MSNRNDWIEFCVEIYKNPFPILKISKFSFRIMTAKVSYFTFILLIAKKMFSFVVWIYSAMRCNFIVRKTSQRASQTEPQIPTKKFYIFIGKKLYHQYMFFYYVLHT